jgi:acyl-[acyl carrier protein]--UDP-N-acetylglucosamine O-acyltransferase
MKKSGIHPTAIVSPKAEIGSRVEIGPFVIVGEGARSVTIASFTRAQHSSAM